MSFNLPDQIFFMNDMFTKILFVMCFITHSKSLIPLPQGHVVHPTSGLAFQYITQYYPADPIIPITVSIPLTKDMCYLLPLHSLEKIHSCRQSADDTSNKRSKRLISEIISIGMGTAALTMSTATSLQLTQLKNDMETITKSLIQQNNITITQLHHFHEGQLKLALVLNHTQIVLNKTVNIINYHHLQFDHLETYAKILDNRLTTFIHTVESHFLHTALADIFANRLNLQFIHHKDLNTVLQFIVASTNITFNNNFTDSTLLNLVSSLLIQQAIHFIPKETNTTLGILSITSFFAANTKRKMSFNIYQLIPIPFPHTGLRVRLANLPVTIGIDFEHSRLITWNVDQIMTCNFQSISTCRETPPIITKWQDTCLYQILTDTILSACRIEIENEPLFFHDMGKQWLISTNSTQTCHFTVFSATNPPTIIKDTVRTLPPVTLVTIPEKTTLICERFSIQAAPKVTDSPLIIWDLSLQEAPTEDTCDFIKYLNNSKKWPKIPYISDEFKAIYNFLENTSTTKSNYNLRNIHRHPFGILIIITIIVTTILFLFVFICLLTCKIRLPSIYLPVSTINDVSTNNK